MGTNYYKMDGTHIGKSSAGGHYCWDCKRTLCESEDLIHYDSKWSSKCPICGQKPVQESLEESSAGKQLGFNDHRTIQAGVRSICTFTWAIDQADLKYIRKVKNEYGRIFTLKEFDEIVNDCPVHYLHMIGEDFS